MHGLKRSLSSKPRRYASARFFTVSIISLRFRLLKADVVIEDGYAPKGSCCDDGRFKFKDCGNWWYNCAEYGLQDYKTWIRFGKDGFTLPLGTEHQAKCKYSSSKVVCPVPEQCDRSRLDDIRDICKELPIVQSIR
jgi:hypothetical protein